jgi:TRAP-type C4-dicarboxylate transport system permease large subunit
LGETSGPLILFARLSEASVGQPFVAALIPGLLAVVLYLITIAIDVRVSPQSAPILDIKERGQLLPALSRCGPAILPFGGLLGGIYAGMRS